MTGLIVVVVLILLLRLYTRITLKRCHCKTCLVGKTVIVTGGNSGIGFQTALGLASRGCKIIIADKDNSGNSVNKIKEETRNNLIFYKHLDLASLESVRSFARDILENEERLDILINNAGTSALGNRLSPDGLVWEMQVNHFGSFLLTHLLIDVLKRSSPSRIIFVSSIMAFFGNLKVNNINKSKFVLDTFPGKSIYPNSKLANAITCKVLAEKLKPFGITINSLHPGAAQTNLYWHKDVYRFSHRLLAYFMYYGITKLFGKTSEEACQTSLHLALCKRLEGVSGKFFLECKEFMQPFKCWNDDFCKNIYLASTKFVRLEEDKILLQ